MLLVVLKGHRYKLRSVKPQGVARSREIPGGGAAPNQKTRLLYEQCWANEELPPAGHSSGKKTSGRCFQ